MRWRYSVSVTLLRLLLCLLLITTAGAAPLLGSSESFHRSAYCRAAGCVLLAREWVGGRLVYSYRVPGAVVVITRDSAGIIQSAGITPPGPQAPAFLAAVTGEERRAVDVDACRSRARPQGYTLEIRPRRVLLCYLEAGRVSLVVSPPLGSTGPP